MTSSSPATAGRMFGMPCMKLGRKAFCGLADEAMVFNLRGDALETALALPEARRFDPMGGRPMREWVEVSVAQAGSAGAGPRRPGRRHRRGEPPGPSSRSAGG